MKTKLRDVKLIIVYEISMVSNLNLAYMHLRLEELFWGFGCRCLLEIFFNYSPLVGIPCLRKLPKKRV